MKYISTRDNFPACDSAKAISVGMVPEGGLFVPESLPKISVPAGSGNAYQETAKNVLTPLLSDFTEQELDECIDSAYNADTFSAESVIEIAPLGDKRGVMELWHGPTAAFKDVALQIMPHFMKVSKRKISETAHTLILVATSGDTGKAALEGFKDCEGITIVVFYPHGGVSEVQRLQMVTTGGANTHVVAVKGNFDDCQTGVKELFGNGDITKALAKKNIVFSSANSINWGRLCPQIAYYFHAYEMLVQRGAIASGEEIDFCVPTGNFGNILAGYYAREMGLPIHTLICASNKNNVLSDFFATGTYDRNREFHRTMSPSMDILISSNLERFVFAATGNNARMIQDLYKQLSETGRFEIDRDTKAYMQGLLVPGWVDEPQVLETIGATYREHNYVADPHTAVGLAVSNQLASTERYTVIDSTASPYKFSGNVVTAIGGKPTDDEFRCVQQLNEITGIPVHRAVSGLRQKTVRHDKVIDIADMRDAVLSIVGDGLN